MKKIAIIAAFAALVIAGCGSKETAAEPTGTTPSTSSATLVAYDLGTKKKGDKGVCVICNSKEGSTAEEEVAETLDYKGKTYVFCNESEKAEFISNPTKFVSGN